MANVGRQLTERNLRKKGFKWKKDRGKDRIYVYCVGNTETAVFTMLSQSRRVKDLGDRLISDMAKQCKLSRGDFLRLVKCPMTEAQYRDVLRQAGHIEDCM